MSRQNLEVARRLVRSVQRTFRDGKVVRLQVFQTRTEALEVVGLRA